MAWTSQTPIPEAVGRAAGGVVNGELIVAGYGSDNASTNIYGYDPGADSWTTYSTTGTEFAAGVGLNGYLWEFGSGTSSGVGSGASRFDPSTDSRDTSITDMPAGRGRAAAVTDGTDIWVLGGENSDISKDDIFKYDVGADSWTDLGGLLTDERFSHGATYFDGYVYVAGGYDSTQSSAIASVERFDPSNNSVTSLSPLPNAHQIVALLHDRTTIYALGEDSVGSNEAAYQYDVSADSWSSFDTPTTSHRYGAAEGIKPSLVGAGGSGQAKYADISETIDANYEPFPPSNLSASQSGDDIALSWDDVNQEDEYRIYRATSSGSTTAGYTQIDTVTADTTSYTDTGLTEGTEYFYRATAANTVGESDVSNEDSAIYPAPAPSQVTVDNADSNDDLPADDADLSWTLNSTDEDAVRVERSRDGGSTWTTAATLAAGSTTYSDTGLLDGEEYVWRAVAEFEDTDSAGTASAATTTFLPDTTTDSITPVDASVEDELTVPNAAVADYGDVRYQIRVSGSGNAYGSDIVVAQGGSAATFTGLADGEQYDIRARSETEHVTGAYVEVTEVTLLPAPGSLGTSNVGTTSLDVVWTDTADNEDGITVDQRQEFSDGFGAWSEVADLAANSTSYSDSTVLPGTTYEYRVSNYTEHVEASSTTQVTTDSERPSDAAPTSGWYAEVDTPSGTTRTPLIVGTPQRDPSVNDLESVTIPVPKDEAWESDIWTDAPVRVWQDGERLPIETLVERRQEAGRTVLVCEGTSDLHKPDTYEFVNTDVHAAFQTVLNDTPYTADITSPTTSNRTFATVDTEGELRDYFSDPGPQDPVIVDASGLHLTQTCFLTEVEDVESGSTHVTDFSGTPDWSANEAVAVPGDSSNVEFTFTLDHEIPAGEVGIGLRFQYESFDGVWKLELDGQVVAEVDATGSGTTASLTWQQANGFGVGTEWTSALGTGDHTVLFSVENYTSGDMYVDVIAPFDERHHPDVSNFDATGDYLDTPRLYPSNGIDAILLHEGFLSATGARVEASFDDLTGDQAIALSNDYGSNYATASNTDTLETDFASPGPDIQMRVTLDAYGSRNDASPTRGFKTQTLQNYTLYEDVRNSPPLTNDQFSGDRKDILTGLVKRGDMLWAAEWDRANSEQVIRMANIGDLNSDRELDVVDYEWSTQTLGRQVERATIKGGTQSVRDETVTANHGTAVQLDHTNLVPGQEIVRDPSSGTVYQRGTDYEMDTYVSGDIRTSASGNITDGQTLEIDYQFKPDGDYAIGGWSDRKRLIETFTSATTDAICQSIAWFLVDELQNPIESGTLTIPDLPPGWSVLETLAVDPLPNDERWVPRGLTVQQGKVVLEVASRRRVQDVVSDIRARLDQHSERI